MKKILLGIATLLTVGANAQLTHVKTLTSFGIDAALVSKLSQNSIEGGKYIINEIKKYSEYDILKSDFTLYKLVTLDTIGFSDFGYAISDVWFSNHIYNTDDKIEVVYTVYNTSTYQTVKTVVLDEDGVKLVTINDVYLDFGKPYQIDGKTYITGSNSNGEFSVYETTGTIPCTPCGSIGSTASKKAPEKAYDITLYPNPTASTITLAINTDKANMLVHIYSMDGKLVKTANVVNGNNLIDTSDLTTGTYIYNVQTDKEVIHASQFIKK